MIIRINNLFKSYYKKHYVLKNLSCEVKENYITGIVGPNGVGKTTLINCLLKLINYNEGEIIWKDKVNKDTVYIPDENLLPDLLTGREYINFLLKIYNRNSVDINEKLLEIYELKNDSLKLIKEYSYGMKKRYF